MRCPACNNVPMTTRIIGVVRVEECPVCAGMWLDHGELRATKDDRLHEFHWFDLDLWKHDADFLGEPSGMYCPDCLGTHSLLTILYGTSQIRIDVCSTCHGIWLDRNEFETILAYIKTTAEEEVLHNYTGTLAAELDRALVGHGPERTSLLDAMTLLDLLKYKFIVEHERLAHILANLPR